MEDQNLGNVQLTGTPTATISHTIQIELRDPEEPSRHAGLLLVLAPELLCVPWVFRDIFRGGRYLFFRYIGIWIRLPTTRNAKSERRQNNDAKSVRYFHS